ncbi:uncharacterized protein PV09_07910 [Verruconis gallopava]|uniref:Uncharacterized protein n=1 Tax=Verruconis gallopava TaxID=253628 RepID=A0A0D2A2I8_9PEZI|nr:uncharacterized protein PV09_07910 [Verruconis gallopava]KIW00555.1 hypothetical protein PV09_07910 [Verruconis gallopava]
MSYNQSFTPQAGEHNLSAQFITPQYPRPNGGSAPRDIPGRPRRQSSVSSGYSSYPPPPIPGYGMTPPGGYSGSPGMAYSPQSGPYATSPTQHMAQPPHQMPMNGASPTSHHSGTYGTSPGHLHPVAAGTSPPGSGWHNPGFAPSSYPTSSYTSTEHRRSSSGSYKSGHHSSDSDRSRHKRRTSMPARYDSPRRPTMTDSILAAWEGIKGAFDKRK